MASRQAEPPSTPESIPVHTGRDPGRLWRALPYLGTLGLSLAAAAVGWATWSAWLQTPWTRDGRVRVYVVAMAPEVAGRVVEVRVRDNQFVRKGDVLVVVDPSDYAIAVSTHTALLQQAEADKNNKQVQAERRNRLTTLSTSDEERQSFDTQATMAVAAMQRERSALAQARVNLERTQIRATVNGWITNLGVRVGDFATVGRRVISVVDADSFWVDAYFEETALAHIRDGDVAHVDLMGYATDLTGHVDSVARGIEVANATPDGAGLASVNPVFTWVRLAQRVPVRVHLDAVPTGVRLVAGTTATVRVDPAAGPARAGAQR